MSEIRISENDIALYEQQLVFGDGLPVVAPYLRVSTDDQVDEGHSLSSQEKFIRETCDRKFGPDRYHLVWVSDEGLSGFLPYRRDGLRKGEYRPGLTLLTELAKRGIITYVVVYKCNRLARNPRTWHEIDQDFFAPNNVVFFSATEGVDNTNDTSRYMIGMLMLNSGWERSQILSACRHGQETRLAQGYPLGQPGYGWQLEDKRQLRRGQRVGIEPAPEQAEVVKQMVEWLLAGWNPPKIARELSSRGILSPRGRREWSKATVRCILKDQHHAGLIKVPKDISEDGLMRGVHWEKRIIEESTFWMVQDRLKTDALVPRSMRFSKKHLFAELAYCGVCGHRMRMATRPETPTRYFCPGNKGSVNHRMFGVRLEWVEEKVLDAIRVLAANPDTLAAAEAEVRRLVDEQDGNLETQETKLVAQLTRNDSEFVSTLREFKRGDYTKVEYEAYRDDLRKERETLERQVAEVREKARHRKSREEKLQRALDALRRFDELWDSMALDEKRAFGSYVIESLVFRPNANNVDVHLKLLFSEEQHFIFPQRGRGGRSSSGLYSLSPAELTTAYYMLRGLNRKQVANIRNVHEDSVKEYERMLVKRTGARDLTHALKIATPVVEERREDLLLSRRRGMRFEEIFTPHQIRILELTAQGLKLREIAEILGIQAVSVGHNRRTIYQKLNVHRAQDALRAARERGLISGTNEWSDKPTPEQMDLLRELALGGTQQEAADRLGTTLIAVKARLKRMSAKFRTGSTAELLDLARERGWLD